jgi:hypothetical protein
MKEMKKRMNSLVALLALLVSGLLLFSCGLSGRAPQEPRPDGLAVREARLRLVTAMKLATVMVVVMLPDARITASGVLLRQDERSSVLLIAGHTARHAIGTRGYAKGAVGESCPIVAVALSERYDLALAKVACSLRGMPARLAPRSPDVGETVYLMGHTLGAPYTLTKGIVGSVRRRINSGSSMGTYMQVSAHALEGNSGGPLFDSEGRLVGVLSGVPHIGVLTPFGHDPLQTTMVPHMALCVPLQHIRNFLASTGLLQ